MTGSEDEQRAVGIISFDFSNALGAVSNKILREKRMKKCYRWTDSEGGGKLAEGPGMESGDQCHKA